MKQFARDNALLRALPLIFIGLASCGEPLPTNRNSHTIDYNYRSTSQRANYIDSASPISALATWSTPRDIWNETFTNNFNSHVFGPSIYLSQNGSRFVSIHKGYGIDFGLNNFIQQDSIVLQNTPTMDWGVSPPFASGTANTNFTNIEFAGDTDNAYAIWRVNGEIFVNFYLADQGWQTETSVGPGEIYYLLVDSKNNAYVIWLENGLVSVALYSPTDGLQTPATYEVLNRLNFATPIIYSNDTIVIGWIAFPDFNTDPFTRTNLVKLNYYIPGTGWGTEAVSPEISSFSSMSSTLVMAPLSDDRTLVVSQIMTGTIYANVYDSPNTTWGKWQNIDYNIERNDFVSGTPKVAFNKTGDAMILWAEKTFDNVGNAVYRVYTNSYNPVADTAGSHWPFPLNVGTVTPSNNANTIVNHELEIHPRLAINDSGQAVALWVDDADANETLYANYFTSASGWSITPDPIVTYDKVTEGSIRDPNVTINNAGAISVVWRQRLGQEFSEDHHVWVSDTQY